MNHRFDVCRDLDQDVLWVYKRAVRERRWKVAEALMCALEELAKSDPACAITVEQGYLFIDHDQESFNA
ncbi:MULTISPECIES: hypothetical protein [Variovorax]|jgi:hypothetical protein|uniref:hypothetical protein n=1 Tax=Variovorax sp. 3P27G3 TaxID=2502214 RepID=UPI0010F51AA8|nr:hypothetical protein [Variovorax sp. 3P27G3]